METRHEKIRTSSVKSSSTFFSCSICAIYNRLSCDKKQFLMFNSYLPGVNTSNNPRRHYDNIFSQKLVDELHDCIEIQPHVIHSINVSD